MRIIFSKTFIIMALLGLAGGTTLSPLAVALTMAQEADPALAASSSEEADNSGETASEGAGEEITAPETTVDEGNSVTETTEVRAARRGGFEDGLRARLNDPSNGDEEEQDSSAADSSDPADGAVPEEETPTASDDPTAEQDQPATTASDPAPAAGAENDPASAGDQELTDLPPSSTDATSTRDALEALKDSGSELREELSSSADRPAANLENNSEQSTDLRQELADNRNDLRDNLRESEPENDGGPRPDLDGGSDGAAGGNEGADVSAPGEAGESIDENSPAGDGSPNQGDDADSQPTDPTAAGEFGSADSQENTDTQSDETGGEAIASEGDVSAAIETGDAQVDSQLNSNVNENDVNFDATVAAAEAALAENPDGDGAGGIDEDALDDIQDAIAANSLDDDVEVTVTNSNEAEVTNSADLSGSSGDNSITGDNVEGSIKTGSAKVISSIVNFVNANIVGSPLFQLVLVSYENLNGDISLTPADISQIDQFSGSCASFLCAGTLEITNTNSAFVLNDVDVSALTGGNTISGTGEVNGAIETGDAEIASNIINLVNANLVGSNLMFAIFNVFGDWVGDLIFPTASEISDLAGGTDSQFFNQYGEVTIENANTADITNTTAVAAETGLNDLTSTASSTAGAVQTGDATAVSNVFNDLNKNVFGGGLFTVFVNALGGWTGQSFNLPGGINLQQADNGTYVFSTDLPSGLLAPDDDFSLAIANTNDATIVNDVALLAGTGENTVSGGGDVQGSILTGNASALSNIFNFVNTNVIGGFWYFGIVNIFGRWTGNASFGQPDLAIAKQAFVDDLPLRQGMTVDYRVAYANNGGASAFNATITDNYDPAVFELVSAPGADTSTNGVLIWNLASLAPAASGFFDYSLRVRTDLSGITSASNSVTISGTPADLSDQDNSDSVELPVSENGSGGGGPGGPLGGGDFNGGDNGNGNGGVGGGGGTVDASPATSGGGGQVDQTPVPDRLTVTKTHDAAGPVTDGDIINFTVTIKNDSLVKVNDVAAYDELVEAATGKKVNSDTYEIGDIFPGETVQITYDLKINGGIGIGDYTNTVTVTSANAAAASASATFTAYEEPVVEKEASAASPAGGGVSTDGQSLRRTGPKVFPKVVKEATAAVEEQPATVAAGQEPASTAPLLSAGNLLGSLMDFTRDGRLFILIGLSLLGLSVFLNGRRWLA